MALSIKNEQVERLVDEVAEMTGETKTEAVRRALAERKERLRLRGAGKLRAERFVRYLEEEVWPNVPRGELGRRLSKEEEEAILGLGPEGA